MGSIAYRHNGIIQIHWTRQKNTNSFMDLYSLCIEILDMEVYRVIVVLVDHITISPLRLCIQIVSVLFIEKKLLVYKNVN
jgi:hypothetical protein